MDDDGDEMGAIALDRAALGELEGSSPASWCSPRPRGYDERRAVWNGSIDRRPALIARCAGVDDVSVTVLFAVCDDGIVLDLGSMKEIGVDPEAATAWAGAGVLLGELDRATQPFGLAVPAGIVTHTGLAGLTSPS